MEPGGPTPPLRGPPRGRISEADAGTLTPRGPVSEDVMVGISERATAIFSSHKHRVSGMLEPQHGPYALALVGAMLGLNQKQLDSELQLTARVGRRALSYEDFMSACEAMVALHGALAQQQIKRLPNNDMSNALRSAFSLYVKLNVGGFVGGDQRMNSNQFTKMCQDAGIMEPNGPASMSTLQISWASCKATFGSTRLQYNQFLKIIGALAAELSGDVFLLVAGLGLQLPTVPPLRNGFRKPDAGEVNLPKPEMVQGVGAHMAAEEAYDKFVQGERGAEKRGDPLARGNISPMKSRVSTNGGVPNWVKAMQADQTGASPMTSGQDIRGIPVIETPDSDDDMPRKPQPRKNVAPAPPDEPIARVKASPMRPRGGKLQPMAGGDGAPPSPEPELVIRADGHHYGGPGQKVDVLSGPVAVRPRGAVRNGITLEQDSPSGPLEPALLPAPPRMRKAVAAPEGFREVVEQQAAAVKALEGRVEEQKVREQELFERVQLLTEKLTEAQAATAVTVQSGCSGAPLPDVPQAKGRTVVSGRCPLTDQVQKLTEQMSEVLARLSALESIRMQPKAPSEPPPKQRNPIGTRTPEFPDEPTPVVVQPTAATWGPPHGRSPRLLEPDGPRVISPLEPVTATQGEWMSRLLLNLDKRVRVLEGASGKGDGDADGEALAEVLKQLRGMQTAASPAPPAPPPPVAAAAASDPAFLKVDPKRKMEKVVDSVDTAPPLMPTGDADLDRRLAALAADMRGKNATVGVLLDMMNQTRGEVAALAGQLNARASSDTVPMMVGQRSPVPPSGPQRNAIRVVDGGLAQPDHVPGLSPPMRRSEAAVDAIVPLEPHIETVMAEQNGIKRAVRELCAAIGVAPPPVVAAIAASEPPPKSSTSAATEAAASVEAVSWGQPGRKNLKEETQEVKRCVESVQADMGELKRQVEQMRAGYGEWPQPLRPDGMAATTVMVAGQAVAPMQPVAPGGARNPVQVTVGAPSLPADQLGLAPGRRPLQAQAGDVAALPDAEVNSLKEELRRVKAFVGLAEPAPTAVALKPAAAVTAVTVGAAAAAAEEGKWADAGRGPQPLKEAVTTVVTDIDGLRKHVKAMDAALRTNIANTNNLTSFINEHAPALQVVAQQTKEGGGAAGRYPVVVKVGELPQQQGMQPPPKRGPLPLQAEGNLEAGVVDPIEYQQLKDQVRHIARFLGGPLEGIGSAKPASPAPPMPAPPGLRQSAKAESVTVQTLGMPGRGGRGGTVADGLGEVSGEVDVLKKQMAAMGHALRAAGISSPAVEAAVATTAVSGPETAGMPGRQRNPMSVTAGGVPAEGAVGFAAPPRYSQAGGEAVANLEPIAADVGRLKDDMRAMKHFLGMSDAGTETQARAPAAAVVQVGAGSGEAGKSTGAEPWGKPGYGGKPVSDADPVRRVGGYGSVGDMARDIDDVRRRQVELEDAMRAANIPLPSGDQATSARMVAAQAGAQRNPIMVSSGLMDRPDAVGFNAPKRPLQPLHAIEGVPEPVISHLGAMQDDLRRVTAFLGLPSVIADSPAPQPQKAAPQEAAATQTVQPQQPWGTAPSGKRDGSTDAASDVPKVEKFSDLVRDVQDYKQRQEGVERVLASMGAQIPWANDPPLQPGQAPLAVRAAPQADPGQQRQRNAINVMVDSTPQGATGFAPPPRKPMASMEGVPENLSPFVAQMADELKRVQAFLGMPAAVIVAAPAGPDAPKTAAPAGAEARSVAVEPWGAPGREPRQPGQEVRNMGEVVRDVDENRQRMVQLEEALRAAGIPIPPPQSVGVSTIAVGGAPEQQGQQRQRNAIQVMAGSPQELGATGFAAPGRKLLPALEGLPEPAQAELSRIADEFKRMQAFLGMSPAGTVAPMAPSADAPKAAAPAGAEARSVAVEPWGAPGREPRQPGQEVRNMGEMVREMDQNRQGMVQLEEALRAAGIPIPPAQSASTIAVGGAPEQQGQQRQRNAIQVMAGSPQELGATGFGAPGRKLLPALEGLPEPAQAELARMADDLKRVQAFLGMSPAGTVAPAGPDAPKAAAPAGAEARSVAVEPWGAPGREPRQPGQEVRNMGDVLKQVDDANQRVRQLEEALKSVGIPVPPPQSAATAVGAATSEHQNQRNKVAVSPGLGALPDASGLVMPKRGPAAADAPSETLPARLEALQDDVKRIKAFLGMQDGATDVPASRNTSDVAKAAGVAAGSEAGPWAGPAREKSGSAAGVDGVAKDLQEVKQQLGELDRALRGAGMGYMLPKEGAAGPNTVQPQEKTGKDKQRGAVGVTSGGLQPPTDASGFKPLARKGELQPIQTPTFVDANDYDKLKDDVNCMKAFMGMQEAKDPKAAPATAAAAAAGVAAAAGSKPWANKSVRDQVEEAQKAVQDVSGELDGLRKKVSDMEEALRAVSGPDKMQPGAAGSRDVKGPGDGQPGSAQRNPISVNPGLVQDSEAKGFAAPSTRKQTVEVPVGIADPVVVAAEDFKQLKKALEDLQGAVGQQAPPAADGKKGKSLKEDTDDIKKFVRAMGKDVGAMGNDMQTLKKHLDDVEAAMNKAVANLAAELAKIKMAKELTEELESPEVKTPRRLEAAGDNMAETINAMAALNAAQQQQLARVGDDGRAEDIDALNEAMRQSENQLARLLAFLKQDVMDRFAVHEKTLIRMAKQIDFIQRMLKGEFDDQREAARESSDNIMSVAALDATVPTVES